MTKVHLLFTLLTTLSRKQLNKNWPRDVTGKFHRWLLLPQKHWDCIWKDVKVLSEKNNNNCNCFWEKQKNNKIEDLFKNLTKTLCLRWRCYSLSSLTPLSCKMRPLFHWGCHLLPGHYWSAPSVGCNPAADGWDLQSLTADQQFG